MKGAEARKSWRKFLILITFHDCVGSVIYLICFIRAMLWPDSNDNGLDERQKGATRTRKKVAQPQCSRTRRPSFGEAAPSRHTSPGNPIKLLRCPTQKHPCPCQIGSRLVVASQTQSEDVRLRQVVTGLKQIIILKKEDNQHRISNQLEVHFNPMRLI